MRVSIFVALLALSACAQQHPDYMPWTYQRDLRCAELIRIHAQETEPVPIEGAHAAPLDQATIVCTSRRKAALARTTEEAKRDVEIALRTSVPRNLGKMTRIEIAKAEVRQARAWFDEWELCLAEHGYKLGPKDGAPEIQILCN